ncbi:MAG: hypothetical protein KAR20_26075, partial [Candidatus Heimdallarchaeota archaeon]|nr:hypothetical protein [Candidatus Heimdallarchaeota archaeon]
MNTLKKKMKTKGNNLEEFALLNKIFGSDRDQFLEYLYKVNPPYFDIWKSFYLSIEPGKTAEAKDLIDNLIIDSLPPEINLLVCCTMLNYYQLRENSTESSKYAESISELSLEGFWEGLRLIYSVQLEEDWNRQKKMLETCLALFPVSVLRYLTLK